MRQDQTIDNNLEDHALFRTDSEPEPELMAGAEPEWREEDDMENLEEEPFPEEEEPHFETPIEPATHKKLPAITGLLCGLFGLSHGAILLAAPMVLPDFIASLANLGLSPAHPILAGLLLWAISRQSNQHPHDPAEFETQLREQFDDFITRISSHEGAGAGIEDADRILMALQRQDEKINNLTRATKMYGKPMVEITTQVSDAANQLRDLQKSIDELGEHASMVKDLKSGLDTVLEQSSEGNKPLVASLDEIKSDIAQLSGQSLEKMTAELASFAEKLGNTIETSLDESKKHLAASIKKHAANTQQTSNGELEDSLRSIQQELSGIATEVSQIKHQPQAASPASAATPTPAAAKKASARASTASNSGAKKKSPPGGLAHSIAGSRKAGGKNVLGAIAKLKNMRK